MVQASTCISIGCTSYYLICTDHFFTFVVYLVYSNTIARAELPISVSVTLHPSSTLGLYKYLTIDFLIIDTQLF